jgi:hypothetical protein
VSENLAVDFIHGKSSPAPVPLTLQEAMAKDAVRVYETGNVNELAVENRGEEPVFIQAGDIVKGGKQDRSLTVSLVLPPHSERIPIASFCVEPGRWSQRGREDVHQFSSAAAAMPSRKAKLAMKAPAPPRMRPNGTWLPIRCIAPPPKFRHASSGSGIMSPALTASCPAISAGAAARCRRRTACRRPSKTTN